MFEDINKWVLGILAPHLFQIGIPGFVLGRNPLGGQDAFVRNVFIPESFFVKLEREVVEKQGMDGKQALYAIGKKFGYRFSNLNHFPKMDPAMGAVNIFSFFETLYAEKIETVPDAQKKTMVLKSKDMAVTRKEGGGYCITVGGCAGIWAYLLDDYSIESGISKIGEGEYTLTAALPAKIAELGLESLNCTEKPETLDDNAYRRMNQPTLNIPQSAFNMQKLMATGLFSYKEGSLKFAISDTRFVPVETWWLYAIEARFGIEMVRDIAKETFAEIGKEVKRQPEPMMFITQMLTAFGFGYVELEKGEGRDIIIFRGYPWIGTEYEKTEFPFIRGAIMGFLEGHIGAIAQIEKVSANSLPNSFVLTFSVEKKA